MNLISCQPRTAIYRGAISGHSVRQRPSGADLALEGRCLIAPSFTAVRGWQTIGVLSLLLLFWWVTLHHLNRFPIIHNDETPLVAAGYKLFQQGIYGQDMHTGHYGHETIYLEVMPLMPWLQGAGSVLWGVGVWQMRLIPVISGLLTLALLFRVASVLINRSVGFLALLFMLFWQWGTGGLEFFGSGISLIDFSRIGRYDILIAPLTLAILWAWIVADKTGKPRHFLLCGLLIGLAGLTNLYGLFWLPAIMLYWLASSHHIALIFTRIGKNTDTNSKMAPSPIRIKDFEGLLWLFGGCFMLMGVWGVMIVTHWAEFKGQFLDFHRQRLALSGLSFYVNNLLTEGHRYFLGINQPQTWMRLGFWLVVLGLPLGLLWLARRLWQRREQSAFLLLVPSLLFPILMALLVQKKTFAYLLIVMPFWIIMLAWGTSRLCQSTRRGWRFAGTVLLMLMVLEGALAMGQFRKMSAVLEPPDAFFAELQQVVPRNGRILGPQSDWHAFPDREYRSFALPFLLTEPGTPAAIPFLSAITQVDPDIIVVDATVREWLADGGYEADFAAYLASREARLTAELLAQDGTWVQVYDSR